MTGLDDHLIIQPMVEGTSGRDVYWDSFVNNRNNLPVVGYPEIAPICLRNPATNVCFIYSFLIPLNKRATFADSNIYQLCLEHDWRVRWLQRATILQFRPGEESDSEIVSYENFITKLLEFAQGELNGKVFLQVFSVDFDQSNYHVSSNPIGQSLLELLRYSPGRLRTNNFIPFLVHQVTLSNLYLLDNHECRLTVPNLLTLNDWVLDDNQNDTEESTAPLYDDVVQNPSGRLSDMTISWILHQTTNYDYLMTLNQLAGRQLGNPNNSAILPWVVDFASPLPHAEWRDLDKTKHQLTKGVNHLDVHYKSSKLTRDRSTHPKASHFTTTTSNKCSDLLRHLVVDEQPTGYDEEGTSASSKVGKTSRWHFEPHHLFDVMPDLAYYTYMARRTPVDILERFVRPSFEPNEFPSSIEQLASRTSEECIPEFYTNPSVFTSIHAEMADLKLPDWCPDPDTFIAYHADALESDHVSTNLHKWIDLTFGCKLIGQSALDARNVHLELTGDQTRMRSSGVTCLFHTPHPQRLTRQQLARFFGPSMPRDLKQTPTAVQSSSRSPTGRSSKSNAVNRINLPADYDPLLLINAYIGLNKFMARETGPPQPVGVQFPLLSSAPTSSATPCNSSIIDLDQLFQRDVECLACLIVELSTCDVVNYTDSPGWSHARRLTSARSSARRYWSSIASCLQRGVELILHPFDDDPTFGRNNDERPFIPSIGELRRSVFHCFPYYFDDVVASRNLLQSLSCFADRVQMPGPLYATLTHQSCSNPLLVPRHALDLIHSDLVQATVRHPAWFIQLLQSNRLFQIFASCGGTNLVESHLLPLIVGLYSARHLARGPPLALVASRHFLRRLLAFITLPALLAKLPQCLTFCLLWRQTPDPSLPVSSDQLIDVNCPITPAGVPTITSTSEDVRVEEPRQQLTLLIPSTSSEPLSSDEKKPVPDADDSVTNVGPVDETVVGQSSSDDESGSTSSNDGEAGRQVNDQSDSRSLDIFSDVDDDEEKPIVSASTGEGRQDKMSSRHETISPFSDGSQQEPTQSPPKNHDNLSQSSSYEQQSAIKDAVTSSSPFFKRHSSTNSPFSVSSSAIEGLVWLATRIGPMATDRHLVGPLLDTLVLCYQQSNSLTPVESSSADLSSLDRLTSFSSTPLLTGDWLASEVLKALEQLVALYGLVFVTDLYLPFCQSAFDCLGSRSSQQLTTAFSSFGQRDLAKCVAGLVFVKQIVAYLPDQHLSVWLEHEKLLDISIKAILLASHPLPALDDNQPVNGDDQISPYSTAGRVTLLNKTIDLLSLLGHRIGFELSRVHFKKVVQLLFVLGLRYSTDRQLSESYFNEASQCLTSSGLPPYSHGGLGQTFSRDMMWHIYLNFCGLVGREFVDQCLGNPVFIHSLLDNGDHKQPASGEAEANHSANVSPIMVKNPVTLDIERREAQEAKLVADSKLYIDGRMHLRNAWAILLDTESHHKSRTKSSFRFNSIGLADLVGHTARINTIEVSKSESYLVTASNDKSVRLWSISDSYNPGWSSSGKQRTASSNASLMLSESSLRPTRPRHTFYEHKRSVVSARLLEPNRLMAALDGQLFVYDIQTGRKVTSTYGQFHNHPLTAMCPSKLSFDSVYCAHKSGQLYLLDTRRPGTMKVGLTFQSGASLIRSLPTGSTLSNGRFVDSNQCDFSVNLSNLLGAWHSLTHSSSHRSNTPNNSGQSSPPFSPSPSCSSSPVTVRSLAATDRLLVCTFSSGHACSIDLRNLQLAHVWRCHSDAVSQFASFTDSWFVSMSDGDRGLGFWSPPPSTNQLISFRLDDHYQQLSASPPRSIGISSISCLASLSNYSLPASRTLLVGGYSPSLSSSSSNLVPLSCSSAADLSPTMGCDLIGSYDLAPDAFDELPSSSSGHHRRLNAATNFKLIGRIGSGQLSVGRSRLSAMALLEQSNGLLVIGNQSGQLNIAY